MKYAETQHCVPSVRETQHEPGGRVPFLHFILLSREYSHEHFKHRNDSLHYLVPSGKLAALRYCRCNPCPGFRETNAGIISWNAQRQAKRSSQSTDHNKETSVLIAVRSPQLRCPMARSGHKVPTFYVPRVIRKNPVAWVTERPLLVCKVSANFWGWTGATWSAWRIPKAVFSAFETGAATFLSK
jgi:hypothetical protein